MDAQLTTTEIDTVREILQDYSPAQQALSTLDHDGRIDVSFDELWVEKNGPPPTYDFKSLPEVTLKVLRQELCRFKPGIQVCLKFSRLRL